MRKPLQMTFPFGFVASVAALVLASAITPYASAVVVPNHSFEPVGGDFDAGDGGIFPNGTTGSPVTEAGWEFTGPTAFKGIFDPNDASFTGSTGDNALLPAPADGGQVAYVDLDDNPLGTIVSPDLGSVLGATLYTLDVAVGRRLDNDFREASDYRVNILLNDVVVGSSSLLVGSDLTAGTFTDLQATFTSSPTAAGELSILLEAVGNDSVSTFQQGLFDNVRLEATPLTDRAPAVPEPMTALLGVAGLGALAVRRR